MTNHPITPPPELVQQWINEEPGIFAEHIANRAAQWGADQELEALLVWLRVKGFDNLAADLLVARRPKPPSAVAQAEALIERFEDGWCPSPAQWNVIREGLAEGRRALETLPE
jgi:hypothetical protein